MMEAQRAKWMDEGNADAVVIPPTELTKMVTGEEDANGGQNSNAGQNVAPGQ